MLRFGATSAAIGLLLVSTWAGAEQQKPEGAGDAYRIEEQQSSEADSNGDASAACLPPVVDATIPDHAEPAAKSKQHDVDYDKGGLDAQMRAAIAAERSAATAERQEIPAWVQIWLAIIGTVIAMIAFVYTVISNRKSEHAMQAQTRAYISVFVTELYRQGGRPGLRFELRTTILNTGQTPAYDVRVISMATNLPHPVPAEVDFRSLLPSPEQIQSRMTLGPQQNRFTQSILTHRLSREDLRRLLTFKDRLYVFGTVSYRDTFGKDRYTNFCHSIVLQQKPAFIANASDRHNDAN